MLNRVRNLFQGLQWRLTLSYTLVTVGALLVAHVIAGLLVWVVVTYSNLYPRAVIAVVEEELAPQIMTYLDGPKPDVRGLAGWLQAAETSAGLSFQSLNFPVAEVSLSDFDENTSLLVLDEHREFLAGVPASIAENHDQILDQAEKTLTAILSGDDDPSRMSQVGSDQTLTIAAPVLNDAQELVGIIVLRTGYPPQGILSGLIAYIGVSLVFFAIAAGAVGTLFGFITARGLTRRLHNVSQATDHWSRGDFSTFIQERSTDELGQLAQRLNRMAEQLQNLLHTRQELAAMDERNRLARDLHDSVKQQVFATTMKLGAARALIEGDAHAARKHLDEAEQLARQAQTELTAIIRELGPASLEENGLGPAIKEQVAEWSRLNKISATVTMFGIDRLPKEIEQALFRVTQEALSNIVRHSQATHVEIEMSANQNDLSVTISDNGIGFDPTLVGGQGVGLRSMRERLEALGGDFRVESAPGRGTRLIATCQVNIGRMG